MLITRTASLGVWPGREQIGMGETGQDLRAWFEGTGCTPAPWPADVSVSSPWGPRHAVDASDLERRFLACLCRADEASFRP